jgi:hypothetical protein
LSYLSAAYFDNVPPKQHIGTARFSGAKKQLHNPKRRESAPWQALLKKQYANTAIVIA